MMKIIIENIDGGQEKAVFYIAEMNENVQKAINILNNEDKIIVSNNDETLPILVSDIFYIESLENKTFVYTKSEVYSSKLKLYDFEKREGFLRISKSIVCQMDKIDSILPFGAGLSSYGRFYIKMQNNEKLLVSRKYAPSIKEAFGL